jgi:N-acetylglucosaminyldiphosphoundecaprenol N-acetyl-beta-D-mannosaminyltransferase
VFLDPLTLEQAAERVLDMALMEGATGPCPFVVTPNLDHALRLREDEQFRRAYASASLVVADGMPLVVAAKWFGRAIPERVAGSDLVPALFARADRSSSDPLRVFLLGGAPGVAERAARRIESHWKRVHVVGTDAPPLGFERDPDENTRILEAIRDARTQVLLVALGAPKQELWVHEHRDRIQARVALCVGATVDFLAGERSRAPKWMQRSGFEWLYRLGTDPRRLATRYARNALLLPRLIVAEWQLRR